MPCESLNAKLQRIQISQLKLQRIRISQLKYLQKEIFAYLAQTVSDSRVYVRTLHRLALWLVIKNKLRICQKKVSYKFIL